MRFLLCFLFALAPAVRLGASDDVLATLRPGHPRLLLASGDWSALRAAAQSDPLRAQLYRQIVAAAGAELSETPIRHVLVGPRLLDQSRKALGHVITCAMAYRLTGERRFLDHARATMLTAAAFPDWNPAHFLDVAEMATAVAIGYDWLYDELTPADRQKIRRALVDKALAYAQPAYDRTDPERESFPFVRGNLTNNWNQVCNGGFVLAALAVAEDEPELARRVIAGMRATLSMAMQAYEPDGAYPEGPIYWRYGTHYNILIFAALESALGTDFGLDRGRGFRRTALYRMEIESPSGLAFNYADGPAELNADSCVTWLGAHYHHPAVTAFNRARLAAMLAGPPNPGDRFIAMHAIWFPASVVAPVPLPLDVRFSGPSQLAIFRSAWNDPAALWCGLKAGSNAVNHGHLDLGSFLLDSDGERWVVDLGADNYNLPGYWDRLTVTGRRWQYYRLNNHGHSTLTLGGALQSPTADAPIVSFGSSPSRAFAVADLTSAYGSEARAVRRGLLLLDRSRVLVQDEIENLRPGQSLTWQLLTGAQVKLEGRRATLTQRGKTLRLEILAPAEVHFEGRPARPPTAVEDQNAGITALVIVVPPAAKARDLSLSVLLTPIGDRWPSLPAPVLTPLVEWK